MVGFDVMRNGVMPRAPPAVQRTGAGPVRNEAAVAVRLRFSRTWKSPRSAPEQNARPSPVSTMAPMPSSSFQAPIWVRVSSRICSFMAFSLSGRLNRMMPTRPRSR